MTCERVGNAVVCARNAARPAGAQPHPCPWPGCDKTVSPWRWGCQPHWHRLPPELQQRLSRAARRRGRGRPLYEPAPPGAAWRAAAIAAQDWIAAYLERQRRPRRTYGQGELFR